MASPQQTKVVFLPGFMQPGDAWLQVAQRLPQRYPSACLDHYEHSFEARLDEIAATGEGAVLCGYSLGGRLALHAAERAPECYRGLVTLGSAGGIEAPDARDARSEADQRLAAWMETQPIEEIVSVWERQPLFADQSDALIDAQRPGRLRQAPRDLALTLRTAGQGALPPIWEALRDVGIPALALAGDLDERYSAAARRLARTLPNGRARTIENAGHAAHLQQPDAVAALLVEFLDEHFVEHVVGDVDA